MVTSSSSNESVPPKEDPITDLNEGPWPGPIERPVASGEINFGKRRLSEFTELKVQKHRQRNHWYRTASAKISQDAAKKERWDYRAEVRIKERNQGLLRGICLSGKGSDDSSLELKFHDSSLMLAYGLLRVCLFGMSNKEVMYWISQFAGLPEPQIPGFVPNKNLRPFIYAVPLEGLNLEKQRKIVGVNDLGVVAGEADDTIYPIIEKLKLQDTIPLWNRETPKAFGLVMACSLFEAEQLALQRAGLTADLINFTLKAGCSHWEDRRQMEMLDWDHGSATVDVRLSNWILIREVQKVKGWARVPTIESADASICLDAVYERLKVFLDRFQTVTTLGDVASQAGRRPISKTEKALINGIQRALHWYGIASREKDRLDKFLAAWITLEAILDCISYPGMFDGKRHEIKKFIDEGIENAPYPKRDDSILNVSADILKSRLLNNDWPLPRKLELFARSFKISLQEGDIPIIRELGRLRAQVLHYGKHEIVIPESKLREMEYLIERLIIAASVCAYMKLEDQQKHTLHILPIGPEGGAAPLLLDGRRVAYELHMTQRAEWVIDGLVYDESNSEVM
jgi:hypothetical protein